MQKAQTIEQCPVNDQGQNTKELQVEHKFFLWGSESSYQSCFLVKMNAFMCFGAV